VRRGYFLVQTLNFRVEVEKVRRDPLLLFLVFDFDGTTSVVSPWCLVPSILIEEVSGREARRVIFRLNPKL
jgi:hypothetical protein